MCRVIRLPLLAALYLGAIQLGFSQGQAVSTLDDDWTTLAVGQRLYGIQYRQDRTVWIFDRKITTCSEGIEQLAISKPSPTKKFVVVYCAAGDGPDRPHIVNLGSRAIYPIISKGIGPDKSLIDEWVSWSPTEDYALLASGGEGFQGPMVLANLKNGFVTDFEYKRLGLSGETEVLDRRSVSWLNASSFRLKFDVVCQVFSDEPRCAYGRCKECDRGIHRSYWVRVNLNPFSITYPSRSHPSGKRARQHASSTLRSRGGIRRVDSR